MNRIHAFAVAKSFTLTTPATYAFALLLGAMAVLLEWAVRPWVGDRVLFLFLLPALLVAAVALGRGPSWLILAMGAVYGASIGSPGTTLAAPGTEQLLAVLAYLAVGTSVVTFGNRLRYSSLRAALAEERLRVAQDETGVGVFDLDYGAGTASVSPSLCQLLGQPVFRGPMPIARWLAMLHPEHVEDSRRAMREMVARGDLRYDREQRIELANGGHRWLLFRVRVDLAPDGSVTRARGAAVDITARKNLEQRFGVALESSTVPFNIMTPVRDASGRVVDFLWTYVNPAAGRAFCREPRDLVGRRIEESFPGVWNQPGLLARYVAVVENGTASEFEIRSNATGNGGWFHVIASPLEGSVAVWFTNITERKHQEAALREADRRKDEFLAVLAHELRNPLAPIRQCVQIARSGAAGETRREWAHGVIERQVQNMSLLLDDLLDVSRITRGTLLLRKSAVALSGVVEAALETARPHVEAKGHRLHVQLPDHPVTFEIDPLRMSQVLGNLLTNAAKYTDPGGHIGLDVRVEADAVVMRVTDDGIGLEPDQLGRIFEMFAQIDDAKARSQGGLGIGLAMSRGLVELHGGRLTARSAGAGRGSEFTVHLPAASCALRRQDGASSPHATVAGPEGASLRMLIADDNIDAADSLAALLRMHGHVVHVAYDGEAALAAFHRFEPHAVLLDVGMPRKSGLEVARAIRGSPAGKRAILIAVTGWGRERDRRDALEAGFDHHTTKPMDPAQIQGFLTTRRAAVLAGPP